MEDNGMNNHLNSDYYLRSFGKRDLLKVKSKGDQSEAQTRDPSNQSKAFGPFF